MLVLHINANQLTAARIAELGQLAVTFGIDIICVNETFLKVGQSLEFPGFKAFRFDRPLIRANKKKGGGVTILIKNGIEANDLGGTFIDGVEIQRIQAKISSRREITIVSLYCPPGKIITDSVASYIRQPKNLLICGDFNAKDPELGTTGVRNAAGRVLIEQAAKLNLRLLSQGEHTYTTRLGRKETLDLFFATEDVAKLAHGVQVLPDIGSDHLPIGLSLKGGKEKPTCYPEIRLDINRANWTTFTEVLQEQCEELDFSNIGSIADIDEALAKLEGCLSLAEKAAIPTVKAGQLKAWKPTSEILAAIATRRRARRLWERWRTAELKTLYNRATKAVKLLITKARAKRFEDRCNELSKLLKDKPRLFWKEFKALSSNKLASDRRNYPPIETANGQNAFTDEAKAATFATHLADKVWVTPDDPNFCKDTAELVSRTLSKNKAEFEHPVAKPRSNAGRWQFYAGETIAIAGKLKTTSPGEDGMQNAVLKKAPPIFWEKATAIFNASMRYSYIPAKWKVAVVCMIPKEGKDWKTVKGYRPISLLNALAKMMERLIARRTVSELKARGILPPSQSAFLNRHTVEDHPFRLAEMASTGLMNKEDTVIVCLDVEGAFDRVWHQGLLYKLRDFGFPNCALAWMASFLDSRTFRVRIGNSHSESRKILGGVPQGSPLSPILYVLYTADLLRGLPRGITNGLFADDIALAKRHIDQKVAIDLLNKALEAVRTWFNKWRLKLNAAKSQVIRISNKERPPPAKLKIGNETIEWCKWVKYLGVWFDCKLLWQKQITTAIKKAQTRMAALHSVCRRRFGLTTEAAITVFQTYVRPILTFGCQAWLGITDHQWERFEVAQRVAMRIALRVPPWTSNIEVNRMAGLETMRVRCSTLAIDWLDRSMANKNLVGKEFLPLLDVPVNTRTYRTGLRTPFAAMKTFAMEVADGMLNR